MKKFKYIYSILLLVCMGTLPLLAQNGITETTVTGFVYESATGKPLAGAKVSIPNLTSAITDEKGAFVLKKSFKGAYLEVVAPGFSATRVAVKTTSGIKIYLFDDSHTGKDQTMITPFTYKNSFSNTQATSNHINTDDYKTGAPTLETILQGATTGLSVNPRGGMPGAGSNLFLNGFNSINCNTQPLIVINGIPYENTPVYSLISGNTITALSDFDVKDIESITVLKDGSSVYGSKAANGVILINTLRAKDPATRINFYTYAGVNLEPSTKYKMMSASQYKTYLTDMLYSKGLSTNEVNALPYINNEVPVVENWGVSGNSDYYRYNQSTNWQNEVLNSSINQNYHLNITGGNETALYAISVGYLGHEGSVKGTSFDRYTTRVDARLTMTDWFKLNANMGFVYSDRHIAYEGMNSNFNPLYASLVKAPFTSAYVYNLAGTRTPNLEDADVLGISNPMAIINKSTTYNNRFRFFGDLNGIITFSKYLQASILVGLTSDKVSEKIFMPDDGIYHDELPSAVVTNESKQLRNGLMQINTDAQLSYKRTFDYVHDLNVRVGSRYQNSSSQLDYGLAYNTSSDEMKTLGDGTSTMAQIGGSIGSWKSITNYLSADYSYLNRYFISLNTSVDGSSRFGKDAEGLKLFGNVFGVFPSVNAAWLISSEKFMQKSCIDQLKLRAGYTVTGNDDIGNYSARSYYVSDDLLGAYGLVRGNVANTKLKWETSKKADVGIDLTFCKERINMSVDLYHSTISNLINVKSIGSATGVGYTIMNDGSMQNQGIDLGVNARLIDGNNLKWDLGVNVSSYKNKLLSRSSDCIDYSYAGATIRSQVGQAVGLFYGYKTNGIYRTAAEASADGLNVRSSGGNLTAFTAGDVRFVNLNSSDKVIDENDMTVIGDPNPDFFGTINSQVRWRNFTLSTVFSYSVGNDIYNAMRASLESMSGTYNQTVAAVNRWRTDGQSTNTPKATWGDPMGNSRFSDRWIEDGSYIRLKTVTLAYDIPVTTTLLKGIQLFVTANNMITLTKYLGYDPEVSAGQSPLYYGIDAGYTPQQRSLLFGVKLGL